MTTLNQLDSALLASMLDAEIPFSKWLHETDAIDNTNYATIRAKFVAWDAAADADGGIIITKPNGNTELKTIDKVPIPPVRS
jgi:hypothetical protein